MAIKMEHVLEKGIGCELLMSARHMEVKLEGACFPMMIFLLEPETRGWIALK